MKKTPVNEIAEDFMLEGELDWRRSWCWMVQGSLNRGFFDARFFNSIFFLHGSPMRVRDRRS